MQDCNSSLEKLVAGGRYKLILKYDVKEVLDSVERIKELAD